MPKLMVHGKAARNSLARGVARLAAAVEPTLQTLDADWARLALRQ